LYVNVSKMAFDMLTSTKELRRPGRPRSDQSRKAILKSTLKLVEKYGFHELCIEDIAANAGVSKATVYRWWPNKAELVLDAFLSVVEAELHFERGIPIRNSLRAQMIRLSRLFSGKVGSVLSAVIGAGQSEPEMLATFRRRWIEPRRIEAKAILREAMDRGEIRSELSPDAILDVLYGAIYFRFLIGRDKLSDKFVDEVLNMVLPGLTTEKS
jgi:AcrR family transcriptional regulator